MAKIAFPLRGYSILCEVTPLDDVNLQCAEHKTPLSGASCYISIEFCKTRWQCSDLIYYIYCI